MFADGNVTSPGNESDLFVVTKFLMSKTMYTNISLTLFIRILYYTFMLHIYFTFQILTFILFFIKNLKVIRIMAAKIINPLVPTILFNNQGHISKKFQPQV